MAVVNCMMLSRLLEIWKLSDHIKHKNLWKCSSFLCVIQVARSGSKLEAEATSQQFPKIIITIIILTMLTSIALPCIVSVSMPVYVSDDKQKEVVMTSM